MNRFGCFLAFIGLTASAAFGASSPVSVVHASSRPATGTAVVYATLRNDGSVADRLVGATSPAASSVGLHQSYTTKTGGSAMGGMQMGGMAMNGMPMDQSMVGMRAISSIALPPHGIVNLKPGGYHLMLDLRHPIHAGDSILVRWHFAHAGWITTKVAVGSMR